MWKEVPTQRTIVELFMNDQPHGFRVFGETEDHWEQAKKFAQEVLEGNRDKPLKIFLRKWEGTEIVFSNADH